MATCVMYPNVFHLGRLDQINSWSLPVAGNIHHVEILEDNFDAMRIVVVDGKEMFRFESNQNPSRNYFKIGNFSCRVNRKNNTLFSCKYVLEVSGKSYEAYKEEYHRKFDIWELTLEGKKWRVVLDKESLELFGNGAKIEAERNFTDNGTITSFLLDNTPCRIQATPCTMSGMTYSLFTPNGLAPKVQGAEL
ncbi:unnamed protein product [Caenorhabditis brenneri]